MSKARPATPTESTPANLVSHELFSSRITLWRRIAAHRGRRILIRRNVKCLIPLVQARWGGDDGQGFTRLPDGQAVGSVEHDRNRGDALAD
jgi:hypothetical protein